MATSCFNSVRGRVIRATLLDSCGVPALDEDGNITTLVTDGFVSVAYSNEIDEGDEIVVKKADGTLCINEPGCPIIKWVNIEATFCQVDPDLVAMMTGWPRVADNDADTVGFRVQSTIECHGGVALEVWSDVTQGFCEEGSAQYVYFLAPWVTQGILGDFTIENDAASFVLSGKAIKGSGWGVGPYDVDLGPGDLPAPLITPIGADDILDIHLTTVAPPVAACGSSDETPACSVLFTVSSAVVDGTTVNVFLTPSVDPALEGPTDAPRCADNIAVINQLDALAAVPGFADIAGGNVYQIGTGIVYPSVAPHTFHGTVSGNTGSGIFSLSATGAVTGTLSVVVTT